MRGGFVEDGAVRVRTYGGTQMNTQRHVVRSLVVMSLLLSAETLHAQDTTRVRRGALLSGAVMVRPQAAAAARADLQTIAIRVAPDSLRVVRNVVRNNINLLEVPIAEITT